MEQYLDYLHYLHYSLLMDLEASPLPPSLLSRLSSDLSSATSSMASSPLPEAISATRDYADRHLLSLVPKALQALDRGLSSSDPKAYLPAATKVLDSSKATRPDALLLSSSESAIPISALKTVFSGLATLFGAPAQPDGGSADSIPVSAEVTILEEDSNASPTT